MTMPSSTHRVASTVGGTQFKTFALGGVAWQGIIPCDSDGTPLGDAEAHNVGVTAVQNVLAALNNCSTVNLTSGNSYTYTGTADSTLGVNSIQASLKTDQNATVYVDQSPDGTNWDIVDTFAYNTALGGQSWTVQAVQSYVRVRVVLATTTDTTYFRLQTVLCPIVEAVPRALSQLGNFRVSLQELHDQFGWKGQFSPVRDLRVCNPYRLIGTSFVGSTIDSNFWVAINNGADSGNTQSTAKVSIASGTANSGYARIQSKRTARYVHGHPHIFRARARFTVLAVAECTRRVGAFTTSGGPSVTPAEGYWFELSDTGALTLKYVTGSGTPTSVASGSFNGDVSQYTMDTNAHTFEIMWTGGGASWFIDDVLIHSVNASTAPLCDPAVAVTAMSENTASGTTSGVVELWSAVILRLGRELTQPTSYYHAAGTTAGVVLKRGSGTLHGIGLFSISNTSVVTLYDNTAASGTVLWTSGSMGANTAPFDVNALKGVPFFIGLTLVVASANSGCTVVYE